MKIRAKFSRGTKVKFISHLDNMRMFERALRRAEIPIQYSAGFNPHPKIVFGLPLSVGVTTEGDFIDFQFAENIQPIDFMRRINNELPQDFEVVEAKTIKNSDNIMTIIDAASYDIEVSFCEDVEEKQIVNVINEFLQKDEIMIEKKTKKGLNEVNIRPWVHKIELKKVYLNYDNGDSIEQDNFVTFSIIVNAGTRNNLKPELFLLALEKILGVKIKPININRTGLYIKVNNEIVDPLDDVVL